VTPRRGDGEFVVEAGPHRVTVVGTRFAARLGPADSLEVAVAQGAVEVRTGGERVHRVEAGGRVEIGADGNAVLEPLSADERQDLSWLLGRRARRAIATAPPQPGGPEPIANAVEDEAPVETETGAAATSTPRPAADDPPAAAEEVEGLDTWERWIVEGELARAEQAIGAHVAAHPIDHRAWAALGHCRRKASKWAGAVSAYLEAARVGPASSANQHRFRAGTLLQDRLGRHSQAAQVFEEYLRHPGAGSLRLDVELRLARAYLATGRRGAARQILERIAGQHAGTAAAVKAGKLLEELEE
jgi:tetratricopeptide (TPR) repeat protein